MDAPDPVAIGSSFIVQYYTVLNKNPESLHNFYSVKSECTYGYEDEEGKSARGLEAVEKVLAANEYENCRVALTSLDCQGSANGGIFVSVVGKLINKDNSPQKFIQSFFLELRDNTYFVLNDVFRFLRDDIHDEEEDVEVEEEEGEEEPEAQVQEPEPAPAPAPVVEAPVPTPAPAATPAPAPAKTEPAPTPAPAKEEKQAAPQPVAAQPAAPATTSPAPAAHKEEKKPAVPEKKESTERAPPKNWASIVSSSEAKPEVTPAPKPHAKPVAKAPAQQREQRDQRENRDRPAVQLPQRERARSPILMDGCSIYASGVSPAVTQEQIANIFNQYGHVRNVVLKPQKGFAFVEYESPAAVQHALSIIRANPPQLEGKNLLIEERKPRSKEGPAASPRGRGRGGPPRGGGRGGPSFGSGPVAPAGGAPAKEGGAGGFDKQRRGGGPRGFAPSPRDSRRGGFGGDRGDRRGSADTRNTQQQQQPRTNAATTAVNNSLNHNTHTNNTTTTTPTPTTGSNAPRGGGQQQTKK